MSAGNVDLVLHAFDAFARGDKAAWCEVTDPDIEAVPIGDWPETEVRGRDAVWDFLVSMEELWEPGRFELSETIEGGDYVIGRMRRKLRGKSSSIEIEYDYWVAFKFADRLATRTQWFETREEAIEAAAR